MPRKSAEAKATERLVVHSDARLRPPSDTAHDVKIEFGEIVGSLPAAHFKAADRPLLLRYCEIIVAIRTTPDMGDYAKLVGLQLRLARALRICPSARQDPKSAGREKAQHGRKPWDP